MSRERCPNGRNHPKEALEITVLEWLGQYADPDLAREMLKAQEVETDNRAEGELATATARLVQLEQAFLNDLDRVDRGKMTEAEYLIRQESRRTEQGQLHSRKAYLEELITTRRNLEAQATTVPLKVGRFLEEFSDLEVPQAKAILQGIIQAAHVFSDRRIELEFR